jgi:hypothetical protein
VDRSKHVRLAGDLLTELPIIDDVSVDEILDIRRELNGPLIRFRGALGKFAEEIKSAPWDKNFEIEAEQLFRKYIGPAVAEIIHEVKANSSLAGLILRKTTMPVLAGGGLLFYLDQLALLPVNAAIAIGGAFASAGVLLDAYKTWQTERLNVEKNQLYFYYKLTTWTR